MRGSGRSAIVLSGSLAMIGSVLQGTATVAVQYREDIAGTYRRVLPQWQCDIGRISPDVPKGTSAQSLLEALVAQISCGLAREICAREKNNRIQYIVLVQMDG